MKDVKFRVYIGEEGEYKGMHEVKSLHLGTNKVIIGIKKYGNVSFELNSKNILIQYAGFRDKNGIDVYEGDIVEAWSAGSRGVFQVKWRQEGSPCWLLYPNFQGRQHWNISATEHYAGKQFISVDGHLESTSRVGFYDDGLTVLGNVYENPIL